MLFLEIREQPIQKHLKQVYTCLTMSTLAAAAGAYIHLFTNILSGNFLTSFAAIGFMLTLFATPDESGKNAKTRIGLLLGFSFCTGIHNCYLKIKFFCLLIHSICRTWTWAPVGYSHPYQSSNHLNSLLVHCPDFYLLLPLCSDVSSRPISIPRRAPSFVVFAPQYPFPGQHLHWINNDLSSMTDNIF